MKYYAYLLDNDGFQDGRKKGLAYALKHKSDWVDIAAVKDEINTYDKGTTVLTYKDTAYNIYKDYVSIDGEYRVYICENRGYDYDNKKFIESEFPEQNTTKTPTESTDGTESSNTKQEESKETTGE